MKQLLSKFENFELTKLVAQSEKLATLLCVDKPEVPEMVCTLYFNGITPCRGGLLALDGQTGNILWQHWSSHAIYWVDCGADLTKDGVKDCLISGRGGVLEAVNGHDGSRIWEVDRSTTSTGYAEQHPILVDTYAGRFVHDLDGDGIQDVLAAHTEDNSENDTGSLCGHLVIVSGNNGRPYHQISAPNGEETYYPPQVLVRIDGQVIVVWGTGGINSSGGLYVEPLLSLIPGQEHWRKTLYWDKFKGVLAPPALVDVNQDGLEDIVVATFNSSVFAFDGQTYEMIWNFSFVGSESSSTPIPGYFNEDDIPDFLVKYQFGPGYPLYYYTQTTLLDGRTGHSILDNVMIDTAGMQSGGLTVSVEGTGNDIFLHWGGNCFNHEGNQEPYAFIPGEKIEVKNSVDLCKLRFNSTLITQFLALSEHFRPPGIPIYSSDARKTVEYQDAVNITTELQNYIDQHPDFWTSYAENKPLAKQSSVEFTPENRVDLLRNRGTNFRHKEGSILDDEQRNNFPSQYGFSNREYVLPNRGRNRETGRTYNPTGEDEMFQPFSANDKYPDIHKHGVHYGNHLSGGQQWQWHDTDAAGETPESQEFLDIPGRTIFDDSIPLQDQDLDVSDPFGFPPSEEGFPPRQREIRTIKSKKQEILHDPQLKGVIGELAQETRNLNQPGGIQKLTSAGVLVPSINNVHNDSIDVVFATYWIPTAEGIHILLKKHMECLEKKIADTGDLSNKYPHMNPQSIETLLAKECLNLSNKEDYKAFASEMDHLKINMGQMTVFRIRLRCQCKSLNVDERCSSILPYDKQSWPTAYGVRGNGYFKPKHK